MIKYNNRKGFVSIGTIYAIFFISAILYSTILIVSSIKDVNVVKKEIILETSTKELSNIMLNYCNNSISRIKLAALSDGDVFFESNVSDLLNISPNNSSQGIDYNNTLEFRGAFLCEKNSINAFANIIKLKYAISVISTKKLYKSVSGTLPINHTSNNNILKLLSDIKLEEFSIYKEFKKKGDIYGYRIKL